MNLKKLIVTSLLNLLLFANITAQRIITENSKDEFKKTFFTGGNLALQFGTVTMVDVAPHVGYYIFENISIGTGFSYQYINDRRFFPSAKLNVFGGRVFTRLHLPFFNSIFATGEYEYLTYKTDIFSQNQIREWYEVHNVLAGIGYRQKIFKNSAFTIAILWNFNESLYTLYSNPIIRTGFDIALFQK